MTSCGTTFSSGFDLRTVKEQDASAQTDEVAVLESLINRLAPSRLITIAALNGLAIGGASDLVLACDLRIATSAAGIRMPAALLGIPLYLGALRRYLLAFGSARGKHLIFTGTPAYAEELLSLGIVSEIVPPERLESRALELAKFLSSMPPLPLQAMKQAVDGLAHGAFDDSRLRIALEQAFDGQQIIRLIEAAHRPTRPSPFGSRSSSQYRDSEKCA
ncbi:enoyl-CoA hydratase/isomerase family protein [Phyllobacterium zundukense]|uniref:Enoyl-CoA hydratase/isomerase family protein n=1 Tax=Phyllobacterium zundukense TaxID=1867719 RepID=A0ACD4CW40_9HYPH|nr:enoyl-CoA hydratase/isomerase family protein [Phyllobacterium zundukense]UXN57807.1 enoyl-CoA hydratase/isomerase family protein [Phyllobacterium zundukense]